MKAEAATPRAGRNGESAWHGHRVVLHADMDAFYAAVEQRERPDLRGRPVIVGGPRHARGVVTAASYEARAFGVHAAMPLQTAARLCPQAAFVPGRMQLYAEVSTHVMDILGAFTPLVEPLSLDEAFLDVSGCERRYGTPTQIAAEVRAQIRRRERLPVSVGVAATKSVAKIASAVAKPDGVKVVPPGHETEFLSPLPVQAVWGIGPKTSARLATEGVQTIGDLTARDAGAARRLLGPAAAAVARAHGHDPRDVVRERRRSSVGNEITFHTDLADRRQVEGYLQQLSDHVAQRLRAKALRGRTVALKLRYADFHTISRQSTLATPVDSGRAIFDAVRALFRAALAPRAHVRLVGVHVSGLSRGGARQLELRPPAARDASGLDVALDRVRARFGDAVITAGSLLGRDARLSADRFTWRDRVLG